MEAKQTLKQFFSSQKCIHVPAKTIFIRPSEKHDFVYLVDSGTVRLFSINDKGEEVSLYQFEQSSVLPLMSALSESKSNYYIETNEACVLYRAPITLFIEFLKSDTELMFSFLVQFGKGLNQMLERTECLLTDDSYGKILKVLRFIAHRSGIKKPDGTHIQIPLTHASIAAWAGIQRETVTRQLDKMSEQGVITYSNKRFILHENAK